MHSFASSVAQIIHGEHIFEMLMLYALSSKWAWFLCKNGQHQHPNSSVRYIFSNRLRSNRAIFEIVKVWESFHYYFVYSIHTEKFFSWILITMSEVFKMAVFLVKWEKLNLQDR